MNPEKAHRERPKIHVVAVLCMQCWSTRKSGERRTSKSRKKKKLRGYALPVLILPLLAPLRHAQRSASSSPTWMRTDTLSWHNRCTPSSLTVHAHWDCRSPPFQAIQSILTRVNRNVFRSGLTELPWVDITRMLETHIYWVKGEWNNAVLTIHYHPCPSTSRCTCPSFYQCPWWYCRSFQVSHLYPHLLVGWMSLHEVVQDQEEGQGQRRSNVWRWESSSIINRWC